MLNPTKTYRVLVFYKKTPPGALTLFKLCNYLGIYACYAGEENSKYIYYKNSIILYEDTKILCKAETVFELLYFIVYGRKNICR